MVLKSSNYILRLPTEVSERIIVASDYQGVACLSQTCRYLYSLIYQREDDDHIWRALFLNTFDEPRKNNESYDWKLQYKRRIKAAHILRLVRERYESMEEPWDNAAEETWGTGLIEAFQVCAVTLRSARPSTRGEDMEFQEFSGSLNLLWLNQNTGAHTTYFWPWLLPSEKMAGHELERIPNTSWLASVFMTQMSARWRLMHLAGIHQELSIPNTTETFEATRLAARAYVYDLRNYRADTDYGPWCTVERSVSSSSRIHPTSRKSRDSSKKVMKINWFHLHSIFAVILGNLEENPPRFLTADEKPPLDYLATRPFSAPGWDKRSQVDWAGVEGRWRRIVCFMDYRDLILYNFGSQLDEFGFDQELRRLDGPLDHSLFQKIDFGEALRFLYVSLKVTRVEDPDTPGLVDPRRPPIHFRGTSNLRAPNESSVYGTVSVTPEGDIRWFMVSTFGGEDRWQSTGVQIGGVGSAMGVMGTWSGFDHHERDPAGPYWLWRIG